MIMYKQVKNQQGQVRDDQIQRVIDGAFIPFDNDNVDYQKYLEWVSQGNQPEPADE